MTWVQPESDTVTARHEERDAADAERVLAQLEYARGRLEERFPVSVGALDIVLHGTSAQLTAAEPWLAVRRALTEPAGRRYLVGWTAPRELHVLTPRVLAPPAAHTA